VSIGDFPAGRCEREELVPAVVVVIDRKVVEEDVRESDLLCDEPFAFVKGARESFSQCGCRFSGEHDFTPALVVRGVAVEVFEAGIHGSKSYLGVMRRVLRRSVKSCATLEVPRPSPPRARPRLLGTTCLIRSVGCGDDLEWRRGRALRPPSFARISLLRYSAFMKSCAISSLLQFGGWLLAGGGLIVLLQQRCAIAPGSSLAPAMFVALLFMVGIWLFVAAFAHRREREQLARALRGEAPEDGKRVVLTGTIHALVDPLVAPFSHQRCVAFRYDISKWVGSGKSQTHAVLCEGVALVRSEIRTASGNYKLLAVPTIDAPAASLDSAALQRAEEHLRTATFAPPHVPFTRPEIENEWSDDDGSYRHERLRSTGPIDLEQCHLSEYVIANGEAVTVVGRYSRERGGIVADRNWANRTRIMTANPEAAAAQLRSKSRRGVLLGIVFFAAAVFMFWSVFGVCF
jgi:hypothetical protein